LQQFRKAHKYLYCIEDYALDELEFTFGAPVDENEKRVVKREALSPRSESQAASLVGGAPAGAAASSLETAAGAVGAADASTMQKVLGKVKLAINAAAQLKAGCFQRRVPSIN
jgi:hypothetical protein